MKKKILPALIALSVVSSVISGCGTTDIPCISQTDVTVTDPAPEESPADNTFTSVSKVPEAAVNMDFNNSLIEFIENYGFQDKNYMISPTSFRAALALAVSGADNDTKSELLKVMGFNDMDELNVWYKSVTASIDSYDEWLKNPGFFL